MNEYQKLERLYLRIEELIKLKVTYFSPQFKGWYNDCVRFLSNHYGKSSVELNNFKKTDFHISYIDEDDEIAYCKEGLETVKITFSSLLDEMKDENVNNTTKITDDKIFIVHGHDGELKYKTAHLLQKLDLSPVILHEQTNSGQTIIEKLEKFGSEARAAIILFTPDDVGKAKSESDSKARSRQNVVFEAGYFIGLLGRKNVMLIVSDKSIELPGDLSGIVYDTDAGEYIIAKELKAMGIDIDFNNLI